jgi:hypothetical protein
MWFRWFFYKCLKEEKFYGANENMEKNTFGLITILN